MNRLFASITLCTLFVFTAKAGNEGVGFGLRAGLDFQNFNGKDNDGAALDMKIVTRYHFGVFVDIPVATDFYVRSGLLFAKKGALDQKNNNGLDYKANYSLSYLDLPLNLLYMPELGQGKLLLGFGPYFAYGIGGKVDYSINNSDKTEKINFDGDYSNSVSNDAQRFKAFDMGAGLFFGYELKNGLGLQLNTQLGLARINARNSLNPNDKGDVKNTGFGLSVSYRFK